MLSRLSKSDFEAIFYSRWILVACTGLVMFVNHYARDAVGALENQMETDLMISVHDYASINAVYFLPSVFSPILGGMYVHKIGAPNCLLYSVLAGCFGHVLFSLGVQYDNMNLLLFGRAIAGFMYEIIDSMPFLLCTPYFTSDWGLVVGLLNGFLRLGSVMNFVISPFVYKSNGVKAALWLATVIFSSSILSAIAIKFILYKGIGSNDYQKVNLNSIVDQDNIVSEEFMDIEQRNLQNETVFSSNSLFIPDESDLNILFTDTDDFSLVKKKKDLKVLPTGEADPDVSDEMTKKNFFQKIWESLATALPLHKFSSQYYMFLLSGSFLYGSMVCTAITLIDNDCDNN
jgi:MFS family permease